MMISLLFVRIGNGVFSVLWPRYKAIDVSGFT